MKYTETQYTLSKEILKFPDHYVGVSVMVSDAGVTANADGKKIVPKGTVVGGVVAPVLTDRNQMVTDKNTAPVAAVKTISTANDNTGLVCTARIPGAAGNGITIAYVNPGSNSAALAVTVATKAISVSLATDGAGAITTTAADIMDAINGDATAGALVIVTPAADSDGSGVVAAVAATNLAGGVDGSCTGAEGILLNDADVTYGPAPGTMMIHGFINLNKLPEPPAPAAVSALPMITFMA